MEGKLCDDLVEEIIQRLPPSSAVEVSLVSKRLLGIYRRTVSHISLSPPLPPSVSYFLSLFPRLSSLSLSSSEDSLLLSAASSCPLLLSLRLPSLPVSFLSLSSLSLSCPFLSSLSFSVSPGFRFDVLSLFASLSEVSVSFTDVLPATRLCSPADNPYLCLIPDNALLRSTRFDSGRENYILSSTRFDSSVGYPNLSSTQFAPSRGNDISGSTRFGPSRGKAILDSTRFGPSREKDILDSSHESSNLSLTQFDSSLDNPFSSLTQFHSSRENPDLSSAQFNSSRENPYLNYSQFNSRLENPSFASPGLNLNIKDPNFGDSASTQFNSMLKGSNLDAELQLETLTLSCIRNDDYALSWLYKSCKKLKKLRFRACESIGDDPSSNSFISCIKNVQEVELRTCRMIVDVVLLKLAEHSKSLKALLVYDGGCREGLLRFIEQSNCDLQKLDFRIPLDLDNRHLIAVAEKFRRLNSLRLQSCCLVTGEGLKAICLSIRDGLEELALINCDVVEKEPGLLTTLGQNLKGLKKLDLSNNETLVDKEFVSMIVSCAKLEELKLRGCRGLSNLSLVSISKSCKNLEFVDIMYCCEIKVKDVELFVSNLPRLRQLSVEENKLSDKIKNWRLKLSH